MKPHVKIVFAVDYDVRPEDFDWYDMSADLKVLVEYDEAKELLVQLAAKVADGCDGCMALELRLSGRAYMTGRLPDEATFSEDEKPMPGVVITDDIHEWPGAD